MTENGERIRVPFEFQEGLEASLYSSGIVLGLKPTVDYNLIPTDEEAAVTFPATLRHSDSRHTDILIHGEFFNEQVEDLTELMSGVERAVLAGDLAKIYVAGSVIPHILICSANPFNSAVVEKLADHMTNPDTLLESISGEILSLGFDEVDIRAAVILKTEEERALINRLRLALGVLGYHQDDAGLEYAPDRQAQDFSSRVTTAYRQNLKTRVDRLKGYQDAAATFGQDSDGATMQYFSELSPIELAASFPMSYGEISVLAALVKKSRE